MAVKQFKTPDITRHVSHILGVSESRSACRGYEGSARGLAEAEERVGYRAYSIT